MLDLLKLKLEDVKAEKEKHCFELRVLEEKEKLLQELIEEATPVTPFPYLTKELSTEEMASTPDTITADPTVY